MIDGITQLAPADSLPRRIERGLDDSFYIGGVCLLSDLEEPWETLVRNLVSFVPLSLLKQREREFCCSSNMQLPRPPFAFVFLFLPLHVGALLL